MLVKDLIKKDKKELEKQVSEIRKQISKVRADAFGEKSLDLGKIRTLKKDYARIRTVLNQKDK